MTKERIRQLESRALRKLRKIAQDEKLDIPGIVSRAWMADRIRGICDTPAGSGDGGPPRRRGPLMLGGSEPASLTISSPEHKMRAGDCAFAKASVAADCDEMKISSAGVSFASPLQGLSLNAILSSLSRWSQPR